MQVINIQDAKRHFSQLVHRVRAGEEIIIGKAGKPVAKLIPFRESAQPRKGGQWHGKVTIAKDFDELPSDLFRARSRH